MRKNIVLLFITAFCTLVALCSIALATVFGRTIIKSIENIYLDQKTLHLRQSVSALRNETLNSNFRYVRNQLEKMKYEGLFEEFDILNENSEILESSTVDKMQRQDLFPVDVPLYFFDTGPVWGAFRFYISKKPIQTIIFEMSRFIGIYTLITIALIMSLFLVLNYLYYRILKHLLLSMKLQIEEGSLSGMSGRLQYIFQPAISLSSRIANEVNEHRKRSQYLESARVYNKLALSVAHDIRSPVSSLKASIPVLKTNPKAAQNLIEMSIQRISDMAEEMLKNRTAEFHKDYHISTQQTESSQNKSFNPTPFINEILLEKESIIKESLKKLRLTIYNDLPEGCEIVGDPLLFQRCFSNLIQNAIEAVEGDGFVSITVALENNLITINIRDNGIGISPENLELLRTNPQSLKKERGSGIGLISSMEYFNNLGGSLSIESEVGRGTVVNIKNPVFDR